MKTSFSILPNGCAVRRIDKSLQDCPLLTGGALMAVAPRNIGVVTLLKASFLDAVNRILVHT